MPRRFIVRIVLTGGVLAAALLAVAGPALAKGATQVRITGPGLARAIVIAEGGEPGQSGQLATLAEQSGLFAVMFGRDSSGSPAQLPTSPPQASLGPSYALIYTVPGVEPAAGQTDGTIRQDLYPYAHGGPLSYTPPGQRGFSGALQIQGWLRTSPELPGTLARLGIQRPTGPAVKQADHGAAKDARVPLIGIGLAATAAGALVGVAWWLRRRTGASPSRAVRM